MVPIYYYLILSAILFSIGIAAFLIKRNIISIFMSIELMLNAVNLTFVAFAHHWHQVSGQIFVFFVMVVAAAEAAVGLAIIISIFRTRNTLDVDLIDVDTDTAVTYQIVGDVEADIKKGLIAVSSPIARALIGKSEGDEFDFTAPNGVKTYSIEKVRYS